MIKHIVFILLVISASAWAGAGPVVIWGPGPSAKFLAPSAAKSGTLAAPSYSFSSDLTSGMFLPSAGDVQVVAGGLLGIDVLKATSANFANVSFGGGPASLSDSFPFSVIRNVAGTTSFLLQNTNAGAGAAPQMIMNSDTGASETASLTLWPNAQATAAYNNRLVMLASGSAIGMSFTTVGATTPFDFRFFPNGVAATNEAFRVGVSSVSLQNDVHLVASAVTAPTITAGCGGTPTVVGSDVTGQVNVGTGGAATTCTVTFNQTWTTAPHCFIQDETSQIVSTSVASTATAMVLTATVAWTASSKLDYFCINHQ